MSVSATADLVRISDEGDADIEYSVRAMAEGTEYGRVKLTYGDKWEATANGSGKTRLFRMMVQAVKWLKGVQTQ